MGKTIKLHRRLVKKRNEIKTHKQAVATLLDVIRIYANPLFWRDSSETRDIKKGEIVVGVEILKRWVGPGNGPEVAQRIIGGIKNGK
jgi:hypothetical protein